MRTLSLVGLASALLMLCACNPPSVPTVAAVTEGETQPSAPPSLSPLVTLNPKKVVTYLLHPTPPEIWKLYRESEHNPSVLFAYIDPNFEFNVKRDPEGAVDPVDEGRRALLRWYATVRLGDIGGAEVIPVLEEAGASLRSPRRDGHRVPFTGDGGAYSLSVAGAGGLCTGDDRLAGGARAARRCSLCTAGRDVAQGSGGGACGRCHPGEGGSACAYQVG